MRREGLNGKHCNKKRKVLIEAGYCELEVSFLTGCAENPPSPEKDIS